MALDELPWNLNDFLAVSNDNFIAAWSYSRKRAYDLGLIKGVSTPWIIPAKCYDENLFDLSEEIKDKMRLHNLDKERNNLIKKIKKGYKN